jgi:hypothetical protein
MTRPARPFLAAAQPAQPVTPNKQRCPLCRRPISIRRSGGMRAHRDRSGVECPGATSYDLRGDGF